MNVLFHIIQKEFIQIVRNKALLPFMTVVPIVQLIILSYAANNEVKNISISIFDQDRTATSRLLIQKIMTSDRFIIHDFPGSIHAVDDQLQDGSIDIAVVVPLKFEQGILDDSRGDVQLLVNAINGQQATVGSAYVTQIVRSLSKDLVTQGSWLDPEAPSGKEPIEIQNMNWYNPDLNFKYFMTPGIMGELVTVLIMLMTAMNIVREREIGTIEQINVTPIKSWQFICGKMFPFLVIGLFLMSVGLVAGKLIFDIPFRGSLWVVFAYCTMNLLAVLGLGLFISNLSNTQQQAMFTTFFFVIIFILMSGLFTPIESMPEWAQLITIPNPIAHFVHVMRSVLLKGSSFYDIAYNFKVTAILAVVFNTLAIASYRKQS